MLSRNPVSHYLKHIILLLDPIEIIDMQKKDHVHEKNYKIDNGIIVVKKKLYRKIVIPVSLRKKLLNLVHDKFGILVSKI